MISHPARYRAVDPCSPSDIATGCRPGGHSFARCVPQGSFQRETVWLGNLVALIATFALATGPAALARLLAAAAGVGGAG